MLTIDDGEPLLSRADFDRVMDTWGPTGDWAYAVKTMYDPLEPDWELPPEYRLDRNETYRRMPMMEPAETVRNLIIHHSTKETYDAIIYHLMVLVSILEGTKDADEKRFIPHDVMKKTVREWVRTKGSN